MLLFQFQYKQWADTRTLEAIKKIDGKTFPDKYAFVLQQLNHTVIVEELFKSRLTNTAATHKSTNTARVPKFDELKNRLETSNLWYLDFVASLEHLHDKIRFVFADGKQGRMSIEEILFHIITHGSYHRGNIAHALDLASTPHPIDGYATFIHQQQPERRYP